MIRRSETKRVLRILRFGEAFAGMITKKIFAHHSGQRKTGCMTRLEENPLTEDTERKEYAKEIKSEQWRTRA
jgi:hypothetical protein